MNLDHQEGHRAPETVKVFQWMSAAESDLEEAKKGRRLAQSNLGRLREKLQAVERHLASNLKQTESLKAENDKLASSSVVEVETNSNLEYGLQESKAPLLAAQGRQVGDFSQCLDYQVADFGSKVKERGLKQEVAIDQSGRRLANCTKETGCAKKKASVLREDLLQRAQKLADHPPEDTTRALEAMARNSNAMVMLKDQKSKELENKERAYAAEESLNIQEKKTQEARVSRINDAAAEQTQKLGMLDDDHVQADTQLKKVQEGLASERSAFHEVVKKVCHLLQQNSGREEEAMLLASSLESCITGKQMTMSDHVKSIAAKVEEVKKGLSQGLTVRSDTDQDLNKILGQNEDMEKQGKVRLEEVDKDTISLGILHQSNACLKENLLVGKQHLQQQFKDFEQEVEEVHNGTHANMKMLKEVFADYESLMNESQMKLKASEEDVSKLGQEYSQALVMIQDQAEHDAMATAMMAALQSSLAVLTETIGSYDEELARHNLEAESTRQEVQKTYDDTMKHMEWNNSRIREDNANKTGQIDALRLTLERSATVEAKPESRKKAEEFSSRGCDGVEPKKKVAKNAPRPRSTIFSSDEDDEFFPSKAIEVPQWPLPEEQVDTAPGQGRSNFKFFKSRNY